MLNISWQTQDLINIALNLGWKKKYTARHTAQPAQTDPANYEQIVNKIVNKMFTIFRLQLEQKSSTI